MSPIRLIINLYHIFTSRGHNATRIELHGGDRVVVAEGIKDGAGSQIPDADAAVEGGGDQVDVVELESGDGAGVANEGAVYLAGADCGGLTRV